MKKLTWFLVYQTVGTFIAMLGIAFYLTSLSSGEVKLDTLLKTVRLNLIEDKLQVLISFGNVLICMFFMIILAATSAWWVTIKKKNKGFSLSIGVFIVSVIPVYCYELLALSLAYDKHYNTISLLIIAMFFCSLGNGLLWWWHEQFKSILNRLQNEKGQLSIAVIGLNPKQYYVKRLFIKKIIQSLPDIWLWCVVNVMFFEALLLNNVMLMDYEIKGILGKIIASLGVNNFIAWDKICASIYFIVIGYWLLQLLVYFILIIMHYPWSHSTRQLWRVISRISNRLLTNSVNIISLILFSIFVITLLTNMNSINWLAYIGGLDSIHTEWLGGISFVISGFLITLIFLDSCFSCLNKPIKNAIWVGLILISGLIIWQQFLDHSEKLALSISIEEITNDNTDIEAEYIEDDLALLEGLEEESESLSEETKSIKEKHGLFYHVIYYMLQSIIAISPGLLLGIMGILSYIYLSIYWLYGRDLENPPWPYILMKNSLSILSQIPPYFIIIMVVWFMAKHNVEQDTRFLVGYSIIFCMLLPLLLKNIQYLIETAADSRFLQSRKAAGFRVMKTYRFLLWSHWGKDIIFTLLLGIGFIFMMETSVALITEGSGILINDDQKHWSEALKDLQLHDSYGFWVLYSLILLVLIYFPQQFLEKDKK